MRRVLLNCLAPNVVAVIMYFLLLDTEGKNCWKIVCTTVHLSHSSFAVFRSSYMILLAQPELCSLNRPFAETGHKAFSESPGPVFDLIMKCKYTEP